MLVLGDPRERAGLAARVSRSGANPTGSGFVARCPHLAVVSAIREASAEFADGAPEEFGWGFDASFDGIGLERVGGKTRRN